MAIHYRCRCGQEIVLRPREGIYLVVGLLVGLTLLNSVLTALLLFRSPPAVDPARASPSFGRPPSSEFDTTPKTASVTPPLDSVDPAVEEFAAARALSAFPKSTAPGDEASRPGFASRDEGSPGSDTGSPSPEVDLGREESPRSYSFPRPAVSLKTACVLWSCHAAAWASAPGAAAILGTSMAI